MSDPITSDNNSKRIDPSRRRSGRPLPDLASLFDQVDQQSQANKPESLLSSLSNEAAGSSDHADQIRDHGSAPLEMLDIGFTDASIQEKPVQRLHLDPALEMYLPPDLWRKLNSTDPRRGVLINSLERMRSVLYLLSTFLPGNLVQEKMRRPVAGLVNGQILTGSLLFSDVSGFTALSERLAVLGLEGAERLTAIMNRYFAAMLEILAWSGGTLIKFAGDAMLVYFPEQEDGCQAGWAVRAGERMLAAMSGFSDIETPLDKVSLKMKIGIGSGEFLATSIGQATRMEYVILGPAALRTMAAEGATTRPGQIVVDEITARQLESYFSLTLQKPGFYNISLQHQDFDDAFEIKAEHRRARGAIPWSASPQAICGQMDIALKQVQAISPYLSAPLVERILAHAQRRRLESEFRPVVTMFCNFTGAEALLDLWAAPGLSRLTSILSAYFNAVQNAIERFGGVITRIDPYSKGSKVLVVFGALISHEDDPQRAVNAALTMNAELEQLNQRLKQKFARYLPAEFEGPLLQQRIGITYGTVFAGQVGGLTRREYTVMGDDVNLAARLMGAARPGQILISQPLETAIGDYFLKTPLEPIRVKGKSKLIQISQVDGPSDFALLRRLEKRGLLVGRQAELRRLNSILDQSIQGKFKLITLQGPAGIGKSHLADEFIKKALAKESQFRVFTVQCQSYAKDSAYSMWNLLLRGMAGITSIDIPPGPLDKLELLITGIGIPEEMVSLLAPMMDIRPQQEAASPSTEGSTLGRTPQAQSLLEDMKHARMIRKASASDLFDQLDRPQVSESGQVWKEINAPLTGNLRQRTYGAVATLFTKLSEICPFGIFIEDSQWLDEASRDLLIYLSKEITNIPVFVLMARRDEDLELSKSGDVLKLNPFTLQETGDLVAHILVSELVELIHTQSDGNPLFIEQISHWIQRTRKVGSKDVRAILQTSDILQKLVLSSLENLPETTQEVIHSAAVIGMKFRIGELQAILQGEIDPVSLSNSLRYLSLARLISQVESGVDATYKFQQSVARDIIYSSLSFERRRELHKRIANYLSSPRQQRSRLHAQIAAFLNSQHNEDKIAGFEEISNHFEKADDFISASQFHLKAAEAARGGSDFEKASQLYLAALRNLEHLQPNVEGAGQIKAQSLVGAGDMAVRNNRLLAAIPLYENARTNFLEYLEPVESAWLAYRMAILLPLQGRAEEAQSLLSTVHPVIGNNPGMICANAWLNWRSGAPFQLTRKTLTSEDVEQPAFFDNSLLETLVEDLNGNWEQAIEGYLSHNMKEAAAIAYIRLGDFFFRQNLLDEANMAYFKAEHLWKDIPSNASGLALVTYRQAEWNLCSNNQLACRDSLNLCLVWLAQAPASIRNEGRSLVKQAFRIIEKNKLTRWPSWRWQAIDDEQHIQVLFPTEAIFLHV